MACLVSWAALWATLISDKPTINIADAPMNKQTKPATIRWEIATEVAIVLVVMSPSVRPVSISSFCSAGLLTRGSLILECLPSFPVANSLKPRRLQFRGQSRFWPLLGRPHRIPS